MKDVCSARDFVKRMERQASNQDKVLSRLVSQEELVSGVDREHSKPRSKKPNSSTGK